MYLERGTVCCYDRPIMDGVSLHRLGKRLIDLARDVTVEDDASALTQGEVAVLEAVLKHPDSSVNEIHLFTGFVQSHVSASIQRLRTRGLLTTSTDPADRRRTRVRLAEPARLAIVQRASRPADAAIARVLDDPAQARRAVALLDELAALLLPTSASDIVPAQSSPAQAESAASCGTAGEDSQ